MSWIRRHLTYANVIATLCLFILLGGGAYAAFQLPKNSVHSKNIANGAIKGKDLKNSAITSKAIKNKSVKDSDIKDLETSDGLVRLSAGQSQVLLTQGPFTLTLKCRVDGDQVTSEVLADSSAPDAFFNSTTGSGPIPPQRQLVNADAQVDDPGEMGSSNFVLASSDGTTLTGMVAAGVNALSSDCFGLATEVGGTGLPSG